MILKITAGCFIAAYVLLFLAIMSVVVALEGDSNDPLA